MATIAIGISPKPGGAATASIPTNALAEDGVPPEQGDKVSFSVEGTVKSVSGGNAQVSIDSVNGEPVAEEASETPEEEAAEPENDTGQQPSASGAPPTSGASPRTALDGALAPMGRPVPPAGAGAASPTIRGRLDRTGIDQMRQRLLRGARGRSLPF